MQNLACKLGNIMDALHNLVSVVYGTFGHLYCIIDIASPSCYSERGSRDDACVAGPPP